ncbi:FecR domain-containing protein [Chitinophaga pendula]|uniref:FecR family protein n=1 Tax=Chitinophaga TaxID=79328 RepID=UPI000BAFD84B|nr:MULTISPECIES: FecR domain-containing protein [Chitinophaga]ASZ11996.1 hypothetical protein CK934_14025 [Chitinophaga sp. MD30]UCJ04975.1 FecR domain-containing protein [Chitinophaga pendula]
MSERLNKIRDWTTEEMAGIISEEDRIALHEAITLDKDAQRIWEETRSHTQRPVIKEKWDKLDANVALLSLEDRLFGKQRRRTRIRKLVAIAAVVLAAAGIWLVFKRGSGRWPGELVSTGIDGKPKVVLKVSSGKLVDLSSGDGSVTVDGIALTNSNRMLTYEANTNPRDNWSTLTVPPGTDYKLELSDGSIVWLNASSTLHFPFNFTGDTREISIRGEAFLQIKKQANKPFIVHLPHSTVNVLGTSFNINTYDSTHIKVSLLEGAVKMNTRHESVLLQPGYEVELKDGKMQTAAHFDADAVLSWRQGIYYFDNAPLSEIALIIPRWHGVEVVLDSDKAATRRISGVLQRDRPLKEFLEQVKMSIGAEYYFEKGVLHFK